MFKYVVALTAFLAGSVTLAQDIPNGGMVLPINTMCLNPSTDMTNLVQDSYGELPMATGITNVQYMKTGQWVSVPFTLYVDPSDNSWSMVGFMPGGPGCLISSGEGFIPAINQTY